MATQLLQVGDALPSVELHEGTPKTKVNIKDLFAGKTGILFGVPGAFTPGCSQVSFLAVGTDCSKVGVSCLDVGALTVGTGCKR